MAEAFDLEIELQKNRHGSLMKGPIVPGVHATKKTIVKLCAGKPHEQVERVLMETGRR